MDDRRPCGRCAGTRTLTRDAFVAVDGTAYPAHTQPCYACQGRGSFGIDRTAADPAEIHTACMDGNAAIDLAHGRRLRKSTIAGGDRLELIGFDVRDLDALKLAGCFTEIIAWKTRAFVPEHALAKVLALWPAA